MAGSRSGSEQPRRRARARRARLEAGLRASIGPSIARATQRIGWVDRPRASAAAIACAHRSRTARRSATRRSREVAQAPDLDVREVRSARQREPVLQVPAGVVEAVGPELDDAEVHQRLAARASVLRPTSLRVARVRGRAPAPARARRRSRRRRASDRRVTASTTASAAPIGAHAERVSLGQRRYAAPLERALGHLRYPKSSASSGPGGASEERGDQRDQRRVLPLEGQRQGAVDEQPGDLRPVLGDLGVPDGLGDLPCARTTPRGRCSATASGSVRAARAQQVREEVVVAEPGPPGVERDDERSPPPARAGALQPAAPDEDVGERAVHLLEDRGAEEQAHVVGLRSSTSASRYSATVRSLPANSATNRSGCGCRASERPTRRSPAPSPRFGRGAARHPGPTARRPTSRGAPASSSEKRQVRGTDLGELPGQAQAVQAQVRVTATPARPAAAGAGGRAGLRAARAPRPSAARAGHR